MSAAIEAVLDVVHTRTDVAGREVQRHRSVVPGGVGTVDHGDRRCHIERDVRGLVDLGVAGIVHRAEVDGVLGALDARERDAWGRVGLPRAAVEAVVRLGHTRAADLVDGRKRVREGRVPPAADTRGGRCRRVDAHRDAVGGFDVAGVRVACSVHGVVDRVELDHVRAVVGAVDRRQDRD